MRSHDFPWGDRLGFEGLGGASRCHGHLIPQSASSREGGRCPKQLE
ncbi:MAG: hypothetical protein AB4290_09535 [Spirulina sp.]